MNNKVLIAVVVLTAVALVSCEQIFTTSVASGLSRPASTVILPAGTTPSQAEEVAQSVLANGSSTQANNLLPAINDLIDSTTDPAAKASLEATAADLAIQASGVGELFSSIVSDLVESVTPNPADLLAAVAALDTNPEVIAACNYLVDDPAALAEASGQTCLLAAVLVIQNAAALAAVTITDYLASGHTSDPEFIDAQALLAAANSKFTTSGSTYETTLATALGSVLP